MSPRKAYQFLLKNKASMDVNVFTHGDYCLPNIICDENKNIGYIDWSQAGIGDKFRDIAPMLKSINRNFGEKYANLFIEYYGIKSNQAMWDKVYYYELIDQFCYCRINY